MIKFLRKLWKNAPLLICFSTFGWAGNCIIARLSAGEISPMVVVFLRWSIVVPILLVMQKDKLTSAYPIIQKKLKWVLAMGGLGLTAFNALFYIAANYTVAVNLGIIQCTMPAIILALAVIFLNTRVSKIEIFGMVVALIGVLIVISEGSLKALIALSANIGDLLALLAVFLYACYTIGLKKSPNMESLTLFTFFAIAAWLASLPLLVFELVMGNTLWPENYEWLFILYIALIPSFLSQVTFMRGVELIGPGKAGLYINLVPIYAAIMGVIILGEPFRLYHLSSLIVVFSGIYIFTILNNKINRL